jgi:hypothetical protein
LTKGWLATQALNSRAAEVIAREIRQNMMDIESSLWMRSISYRPLCASALECISVGK